MQNDGTSVREWQEIVAEASRERDPEKLRKLAEELERALDERAKTLPPQTVPINSQRKSARAERAIVSAGEAR